MRSASLIAGGTRSLPSEVGSSFLHFSVGEICTYLLHWFLLRIFACDSPLNEDFVNTFSRWRAALGEEDGTHVGLFEELLKTAVILPIDRNVFTEEVLSLDREVREKYLGIYDAPTPFSKILDNIRIGNSHSSRLYMLVVFLHEYFRPIHCGSRPEIATHVQKAQVGHAFLV